MCRYSVYTVLRSLLLVYLYVQVQDLDYILSTVEWASCLEVIAFGIFVCASPRPGLHIEYSGMGILS